MKASGIEWIGDIPEHWEVKVLKRLLDEPLKYGANEAAEFENKNHPRYIRITDFGYDGLLKKDTFKSLSPDIAEPFLLEEGDILFARSGATVGKTFQFKKYDGKACFAGYLIKAHPKSYLMTSDYLYYFTKSSAYDIWKESIFTQSTIQNIGADKYAYLPISIPNVNIQKQIADFLDEATSKIDEAIKTKKAQLQSLEKLKKSIIHKAVTKGLDDEVSMKDSGIEWIGDIPKHWKIERLKDIVEINNNSLLSNTEKDFLLKYIEISNVNNQGIISKDNIKELTFEDAPSRAKRIICEGDTIVSSVRPNLQALAYINSNETNLICSTGFFTNRVIYNKKHDKKFVYYFLLSEFSRQSFISFGKGVGYPSVSDIDYCNLKVLCPKYVEQEKIVEYLEIETEKINTLKENVSKQVSKLEEYKKSLIYEYVTGKKQIKG